MLARDKHPSDPCTVHEITPRLLNPKGPEVLVTDKPFQPNVKKPKLIGPILS
jgi:hypothetical protein